jgi:alpha-amylase
MSNTRILTILLVLFYSEYSYSSAHYKNKISPDTGNASENPVILQAFDWYIKDPDSANPEPESNLWQFIADNKASEIAADGFTHVWLPPTGKAFSLDNSYNVGYAIYDHYDLGEFNQMGRVRTKYGTKDELITAVNKLHSYGIKVLADVVMNHMMGSDTVSNIPFDYAYKVNSDSTVTELPKGEVATYVDFNFNNKVDVAPRGNTYSDFHWTKEDFTGMENYGTYYLFSGQTLGKVNYLGDLTQLPAQDQNIYKQLRSDIILGLDLNLAKLDVQNEMIRWSQWLVRTVGFDGFRVDAVRHMDIPFVKYWADSMKTFMVKAGKNTGLIIFGEAWDGWAERLNSYLEGLPQNNNLVYSKQTGTNNYCGINRSMSLLDVPLHYDFQKIAKQNNSYPLVRMKDLPSRGLIASNPNYAVTFVDNHDTLPTQQLASYIPVHTKLQAYAFTLLNEYGTPIVFYRDLYKGNFVSPYENDNFDYLNYGIKSLLKLRRLYAFGTGQYFVDQNKPGVLGYKRKGDSTHTKSGVIYLIKEFDSADNGIAVPTDGRTWKLALGSGYIQEGKFYLSNGWNVAAWIPE